MTLSRFIIFFLSLSIFLSLLGCENNSVPPIPDAPDKGGGVFDPTEPIPNDKTFCREQPEMCTQQYDPVTGSDGNEYSNGCVACSSGVKWFEKI